MEAISNVDIKVRIERDNPWWEDPDYVIPESASPRRVYFGPFKSLALNADIRRAAILLGPRRVGKTYMLKQLISEAIGSGYKRRSILYVSIDTPIYSGMPLEQFLSFIRFQDKEPKIVIFDEIQYLRDWETHLKDLVDTYTDIKFIASGSAAAALRLKSRESGAGRFSDFMLPPLTFYEFLSFLEEDAIYIEKTDPVDGLPDVPNYKIKDIDGLNNRFIDYLNYGGYPEAVMNDEIRRNPEQFIKNDIIDKVLLKDLPSLYGISGIQELNKLFSFLAYNAGHEASFENIAQQSGITKPTIKRYIEYLESAFLIIKLSNVDENCRSMERERNFKIYLNNPSMRAALFAPVSRENNALIGQLAECAIFSQWQHAPSFSNLRYARWRQGEVDIVYLDGGQKPGWVGEIKWSDSLRNKWKQETSGLSHLAKRHASIRTAFITTKTIENRSSIEGKPLTIHPSAAYCYLVGRNITSRLDTVGG